jgi:hypothetical protein
MPAVTIPVNPRPMVARPTAPMPVTAQPAMSHRPRSLPSEGHGRSTRSNSDEPRPTGGVGTRDEEI